MEISFYPTRPSFLEFIKRNLDEGVYEKSEYSQPNLLEYTIKGEEAEPGDVTIYNGEKIIGKVIADSDGDFQFTFETEYSTVYRIRAMDSNDNKSNFLDFELFNFVTLLYIVSREMDDTRKQIAQKKQNIYVEEKVGDSLEDLFFVNQSKFQTELLELMDKFVYGNITDYLDEKERDIYTEKNVSKSMQISEMGCLIKSLNYLKQIFINLLKDTNLDVFLYSQSDFTTVLRSPTNSFIAEKKPGGYFNKIGEKNVGWGYSEVSLSWCYWIGISDNNQYFAGVDHDGDIIYLYKIESDHSLTLLDSYDVGSGSGQVNGICSIYFEGNDALYAGSNRDQEGIYKFDISGETLNLTQHNTLEGSQCWCMLVDGNHLYTGKNDQATSRLKSDLSRVDLTGEEAKTITNNGSDIWVDESQLNTLVYIDASDPTNLVATGVISNMNARALLYWNNCLLVANSGSFSNKKFKIYDVSNPSTPNYPLVGECDLPSGSPTSITMDVVSKIVFLGGSERIYSIDVSDTSNPLVLDSYTSGLKSIAYNNDEGVLYGVSGTGGLLEYFEVTKHVVKVPEIPIRYKYEYGLLAIQENPKYIDSDIDGYKWIYVDGAKDADGTWTIQESTTQPLPLTTDESEVVFVSGGGIYTDEEGYVTGLKNQRYIKTEKHVLAEETYTVYDFNNEEIDSAKLLGGELVALGIFEDYVSVKIDYKTRYEPRILAVVEMKDGEIIDIHRTYTQADHAEVGHLQLDKDTNIFIKTDEVPTGKEKDLMSYCFSTLLLVNSPKNIFINKYNMVSNPTANENIGLYVRDWTGITGAGS